MTAWMLAAAAGLIAASRLPALPPVQLVIALLPLLLPPGLAGPPAVRLAALFAAGMSWGILSGHSLLVHMLPARLEGSDLSLQVCIEDLPRSRREQHRVVWRFRARVLPGAPDRSWSGRNVELSWYGGPGLRPGELWELPVRLRAPRGFVNPGGADRQARLAAEGVDAVGYVADGKGRRARRIGTCAAGADPLREALRERVLEHYGSHPRVAGLLALTLGDGSYFGRSDWELFARTGTTHLMVISGMHIALLAGLALTGGAWLAARVPCVLRRVAARSAGALLALPTVAFYASLAGMSVSVRRAVIMCGVGLMFLLARRAPAVWAGFALALLLVLGIQPLAAVQAGFWLSFIAVAGLIAVFGARLGRPSRGEVLWRPQFVASVVVALPLTLAGQVQAPLGPLVNAIAIPLVDLLVVPMALAGVLLLPLSEALAALPLRVALSGLELLHGLLQFAAGLSPPFIAGGADAGPWQIALAALGSVWLLAPRGVRGRPCGLLLVLPLLLPLRATPGLLDLLVLDVGQGTAVVVRTNSHVLVYDAGPRFGEGFEAGAGIVAPALRVRGSERVDRLVLSHADLDHAGGGPGLLRALPIDDVLAGEPVPGIPTRACRRGQRWIWDGVSFEVLHPSGAAVGNESSCVIRIRAGGSSILLAGDIGASSERILAAGSAGSIAADVLLVPHHGSRGSSTRAFLRAVRPRYAIVSAGHRNRFGHPHPDVLARYREAGAQLLNTAQDGAVLLRVERTGRLLAPLRWRREAHRFWFRE